MFVRAPLPVGSHHLDQVPPDREAAALALMNALGAGWVDLHQLALPPGAFGDVVHAAEPGRALISAALADALHAADILGGGSLPPATPPIAPVAVRREGEPPVIPMGPLERVAPPGCRWSMPLPELAAVADDALIDVGVGPASPVVAVDGGVALRPHTAPPPPEEGCTASLQHLRDGLHLSASAPTEAPTLTVALADELPLLLPSGEAAWWVYPGTSVSFTFEAPWRRGPLSVYARARVFGERGPGGDGETSPGRVEVGGEAAPLVREGRVWTARLTGAPPEGAWTLRVVADAWMLVEEIRLGEADPVEVPVDLIGGPLQPVSLLAAGPPVPRARPLPDEAPTFADAQATSDRIGFPCPALHRSGTAEAPGAIDRVGCFGAGGWLLPGDDASITARPEFLDHLRLGADRIRLEGYAFGPTGGKGADTTSLRVEVTPHGADAPVLARASGGFPNVGPLARVEWAVDPPLPPRAQVDVHLLRPDDGRYLLLRGAWLVESESMPGGTDVPATAP